MATLAQKPTRELTDLEKRVLSSIKSDLELMVGKIGGLKVEPEERGAILAFLVEPADLKDQVTWERLRRNGGSPVLAAKKVLSQIMGGSFELEVMGW